MISLIDDGIAVRSRSSEDCMAFGMRLQEALNEFTSDFLPHMKEEEEVFQVPASVGSVCDFGFFTIRSYL